MLGELQLTECESPAFLCIEGTSPEGDDIAAAVVAAYLLMGTTLFKGSDRAKSVLKFVEFAGPRGRLGTDSTVLL